MRWCGSNKYLRVRTELCKEGLDRGRLEIKYTHTSKMIADGLTKPLEGKPFMNFASKELGIIQQDKTTGGR